MRELTADRFISLDGFASGVKQRAGDPLRSIGSVSLAKSMMQLE
jgi:hypothetical protein